MEIKSAFVNYLSSWLLKLLKHPSSTSRKTILEDSMFLLLSIGFKLGFIDTYPELVYDQIRWRKLFLFVLRKILPPFKITQLFQLVLGLSIWNPSYVPRSLLYSYTGDYENSEKYFHQSRSHNYFRYWKQINPNNSQSW